MILRQVLLQGAQALRDAGIEGPERDARLLLAEVVGLDPARLALEPDFPVGAEDAEKFHRLLARRAAREPVSKILGRRNFWGRDFEINPDVLDPRPETETLIDLCLQEPPAKRLIDLGCGSGIIAVTLLAEWPTAQGVACDISGPCLDTTQRNAVTHGVNDRLGVNKSSWFNEIKGEFDLIVSNPPYISDEEMHGLSPDVLNHDPHLALTPGGDGLSPYEELAQGAMQHLSKGGRILVEMGWRQGAAVMAIFNAAGLTDVSCHKDLNGHDRVVSARRT
ncbi:MAG: peptide chain release factor N(5)-glutamine methyltransferase [Cognatishimia sp.]|uniref:peptide chain release factor N(5)-glutamine methyltransferase n=1 Tax=Cognatishimia sp. TaxID=2211648 RepID=UPI0040588F40